MKSLIAISSCHKERNKGCHEAIRETWLRNNTFFDYKFFVGRGELHSPLLADEILLDVPDEYELITGKTQAICKYAVDSGYDYVFKADRDTYIFPDRLAVSGYEAHDYVGHFPGHPFVGEVSTLPDAKGRHWYASGGCGFWLSARAASLIVAAPAYDEKSLCNGGYHADDFWIPNVLVPAGLKGWHDPRYWFKANYNDDGLVLTIHLSQGTGNYKPDDMRKMHAIAMKGASSWMPR